jgi:hypothetical protein
VVRYFCTSTLVPQNIIPPPPHTIVTPPLDETLASLVGSHATMNQLIDDGELEFPYVFGNIIAKENRCDMKVSMSSSAVRAFLHEKCAKLKSVLEGFGTESAVLCELSSLHSFPGSTSQDAHADTVGPHVCGRVCIHF